MCSHSRLAEYVPPGSRVRKRTVLRVLGLHRYASDRWLGATSPHAVRFWKKVMDACSYDEWFVEHPDHERARRR